MTEASDKGTSPKTRDLPEDIPCIECNDILTPENRSVESKTCRSCYRGKYSPEFKGVRKTHEP